MFGELTRRTQYVVGPIAVTDIGSNISPGADLLGDTPMVEEAAVGGVDAAVGDGSMVAAGVLGATLALLLAP